MTTEELNQYSRNKVKEILLSGDGKKPFASIMGDKALSENEKHLVLCSVAKASMEIECKRAMDTNPNTLMRENTGPNTFISACMNHYAGSYFEAVAKVGVEANTKSIRNEKGEVISRQEPDELDSAKKMLKAYTTELPKLSKEATQFMKVAVDVIKDRMPEHQEQAIPKVLSNNVVLRGVAPKVTVAWSQLPENKSANNQKSDIENEMAKPDREIDGQREAIKDINKKIETLTEGKTTLSEPTEIENANQEIEALEKQKVEHQNKIKELQQKSVEAKLLGAEKLKPLEPQLNEYQAGSNAINAVMELANKPHAKAGELDRDLGNELLGEQALVSEFKESLGKIGNGGLAQHVEVGQLPEVGDLGKIAHEVKLEKAQIQLAKEREPIQPELNKIAKLEKQLDRMSKGSLWEKLKALPQGGLEKAKEKLIAKIDEVKLEALQKVNPEMAGKLNEQNKASIETLRDDRSLYTAQKLEHLKATARLDEIERELNIDESLKSSNLPGMSDEKREQLQVEREVTLGDININAEGAGRFDQLNSEVKALEKNVSVRQTLGSSVGQKVEAPHQGIKVN